MSAPAPVGSAVCPYCKASLHKPEDRPFFVCEAEYWADDGECIEAKFTTHSTRDDAVRTGRGLAHGWSFIATGPHYPERHCLPCTKGSW